MKFKFKVNVVLEKEFVVEAENPGDAMRNIENQIYEDSDLNMFDITRTSFDLSDKSVRDYNKKRSKEIIEKLKKK